MSATLYCAHDEGEAVAITALGTPLCPTCVEAYTLGQGLPDAEIESVDEVFITGGPGYCGNCEQPTSYLVIDGVAFLRLCTGCMEVFACGQESPTDPIFQLEEVQWERDERDVCHITAIWDPGRQCWRDLAAIDGGASGVQP